MSVHELADPRVAPRPPESPRHLRLVGVEELAARRRRRRVRLGGIVLTVFVIGLLFAAVAMHVVLAQNQFRLDRLTGQGAAEQARYQQLRLQVDQLESPARIIGIAQGRLGMVMPSGVTYLAPAAATGPSAAGISGPVTGSSGTGPSSVLGGPAPAAPPAGWSTIKRQLAGNP
jgi:cell division protein FtsL